MAFEIKDPYLKRSTDCLNIILQRGSEIRSDDAKKIIKLVNEVQKAVAKRDRVTAEEKTQEAEFWLNAQNLPVIGG